MAGKPQQNQHLPQQNQHLPQHRMLQASYLIPSYKKALPHALLYECPDDCRLRKIEATCNCKITWGNLPKRLADRYFLMQMAFDPKRGNYLGAINLIRQYFLGNSAMIPFNQTLLRPNGSQITKKFPTSLDECRLLMPKFDRHGRAAVADLEAAMTAAATMRAEAFAQLADKLTESCLRCLAMHAAFIESEAAEAAASMSTNKRLYENEAALRAVVAAAAAEAAAAEAAAAEAAAAEAAAEEVAYAAETVAQCEICRGCVCALFEAAEATRLLAQLEEGRQHRRLSVSPSRRRIDFRLAPATIQPQQQAAQQQPQQQQACSTTCQANNHHRPSSSRSRDRRQPQQLQKHQLRQHQQQNNRQQQRQNRNQAEESCATTLADVEAITFAEFEYVDNKPTRTLAETNVSVVPPTGATSPGVAPMPESLLLCGIQPSAASALSALDRSDRRLKTVERRTGCRLELQERRCDTAMSQQVSYVLQVVPLRPDARPRGCVNMLRTLLHRLDPSYRFGVVGAADTMHSSRSKSVAAPEIRRQHRHSRRRPQSQQHQQYQRKSWLPSRLQSPAPVSISLPVTPGPSAVALCAGHLLHQVVVDCVLSASATTTAAAATAFAGHRRRRLEVCRETVLNDALICIFRSLTATEDDAQLLGEVIDGGGADALTDAWMASSSTASASAAVSSEASSRSDEFRIVRDAIQRTLIACAEERRVRYLLGAFACLPPTELPSPDSECGESRSASTTPLATISVRRRLAQVTLTCWERICSEALCASAESGVRILLEAAVTEAATESVFGQLTTARLTLQDVVRRPPVDNGDTVVVRDLLRWGRQNRYHRQRRSSSRVRRLRPLLVMALKKLLVDKLESAVNCRVSVAAAVTHIAVGLITEQVWNTCLKTQLLMRLRLRAS